MKYFLILLLLCQSLCYALEPTPNPHEITGTVTRVWDGDTVTLQTNERSYRIRIAGIDAPEHDQPFGRQATNCLCYLTLNRQVKAHILEQDKYHRYVARLYLQEQPDFLPPSQGFPADLDVGHYLIRNGLAWHYFFYDKGNPHYEEYSKAEKAAKDENLGLWQELCPKPPWSHRNEKTAA